MRTPSHGVTAESDKYAREVEASSARRMQVGIEYPGDRSEVFILSPPANWSRRSSGCRFVDHSEHTCT